jgi:hypothetical protein
VGENVVVRTRRIVVAFGPVVGSLSPALLAAAGPSSAATEKVAAYCHCTDADSNPYVLHTSDADSIIDAGHGSHTGPVFPGKTVRDIIPPFY